MTQERWEGGHIHVQADGRRLYVIEKRRGGKKGKKFHLSTRCYTPSAAYEHWKRFQADPWAYEKEMKEGREPNEGLHITADLVLEFRQWMVNRPRPTTRKHAAEMASLMNDWLDDLGAVDLRKLDLGVLKAKLAKRANQQHRIIAIKAFCSWLREERHVLSRRDDATLDLVVPQSTPEKAKRTKAVPLQHVRAALRKLRGPYRDCLLVMAHLGWHVSELERFVRSPEATITDVPPKLRRKLRIPTVAVLQVLHKSRVFTRSGITDPKVAEAAHRLRERGQVPRKLNSHLYTACGKAGIPRFTFGVMRHSAGSWLLAEGNLAENVADFLDHASKDMLLKRYADVPIPKVIVRQPKLL